MPFGNSASVLVPEGHRENSPAFQRWVEAGRQASPGGTTENWVSISGFLSSLRDSGGRQPRDPALKRWAIVECPSGTDSYPISRKALTLQGYLVDDRTHPLLWVGNFQGFAADHFFVCSGANLHGLLKQAIEQLAS